MGQADALAAAMRLDATCAMICVAMLQAVEKECGFSIKVPEMTVPVLQHIVQVDEVAVVHMLGIIVGIVEVDDAFLVRLDNLRGSSIRIVRSLLTSPAI